MTETGADGHHVRANGVAEWLNTSTLVERTTWRSNSSTLARYPPSRTATEIRPSGMAFSTVSSTRGSCRAVRVAFRIVFPVGPRLFP